eukprot:6129835-Prymnesium_polylepis.2
MATCWPPVHLQKLSLPAKLSQSVTRAVGRRVAPRTRRGRSSTPSSPWPGRARSRPGRARGSRVGAVGRRASACGRHKKFYSDVARLHHPRRLRARGRHLRSARDPLPPPPRLPVGYAPSNSIRMYSHATTPVTRQYPTTTSPHVAMWQRRHTSPHATSRRTQRLPPYLPPVMRWGCASRAAVVAPH